MSDREFAVCTTYDPSTRLHLVACTCGAHFDIGLCELEDMQHAWEKVWHEAHIENHLFNHKFLSLPSNPPETKTDE